jgi:2-amino-4-hydroxy-6-hydroxymethyldihydropteridine diphosphokinase
MYVTDQPSFLNGVIEIETDLAPKELLKRIKMVEQDLGRDIQCGERNGPRPIDLDILFYRVNQDSIEEPCLVVKDDEELVIPHPRLSEREFVLEPLVDIGASNLIHPILNQTVGQLFRNLLQEKQTSEAVAVLPLPRGRMLYLNETLVMGILNVTPDSFSDGGLYSGKSAVQQAIQMVKDGASIIDVGGESTRPGSKETDIEEELRRTIPVISGIRERE